MKPWRCLVLLGCIVVVISAPAYGQVSYGSGLGLGRSGALPFVGIGYQHISLGLNIDIPTTAGSPILGGTISGSSGVEFKLANTGAWTGITGVEVPVTPNLVVFGGAEGAVARSGKAVTPMEPFWALVGPQRVEWSGSKLQWWSLRGGAGFALWDSVTVVGGLKAERFTLKFDNPADESGALQVLQGLGNQYTADLRAGIFVPYFGLRIAGPAYRAAINYSPWATALVKLPFRYSYNLGVSPDYEEAAYRMNRSGQFLEVLAEYTANMVGFDVGFWFKGSLLDVRGDVDETFTRTYLPFGYVSAQNSASGAGKLKYGIIGGGLSIQIPF